MGPLFLQHIRMLLLLQLRMPLNLHLTPLLQLQGAGAVIPYQLTRCLAQQQ